MRKNDTIAALCTAPGGALAIIRISGAGALAAASRVWSSRQPLSAGHPRRLTFGHAVCEDGSRGESCMAVYMPGPASYTGEDVVEIQCHGGEFAPKRMLEQVLHAGARLAEPGEFTRRAFLNGKMDLTQAEAVADLISARSESALRIAERQLSGSLGNRIRACSGQLRHLLAEIESRLDFPEENLDWEPRDSLLRQFSEIDSDLRGLLASRETGAVFRNGVKLVIAGAPNVGKSSLLNALLGYDRAIVSQIPGTTRDTLRETASLRGVTVDLTDTAGIREQTDDVIENLGIKRSRTTLAGAEIVFWLFDASATSDDDLRRMRETVPQNAETIVVWNKTDLLPGPFVIPDTGRPSAAVSARTGEGIDKLLDLFEQAVWKNNDRTEPECAVSARHALLLEEALDSLERTVCEIRRESYELAAANLRHAIEQIASITGETASVDVLEEIFSRFCIGK